MRYNPVYDTWVAVAEQRQARPSDYHGKDTVLEKPSDFCPFCEGHESLTPAEVDAIPMPISGVTSEITLDNYRRPNGPGWMVRAVPNRFPFLEPSQECILQQFGPHLATPNVGKQEVLIDLPMHSATLGTLGPEEFQYLVHFYHRRLHQIRKEGRWLYAQLFKNQGAAAGASLRHLHSQLAVLPFVPPSVAREQDFLARYQTENGICYHCAVLEYELRERWRFVAETDYFAVFCPFASRYAGEVHIMPKRHVACFVQSTREELDELAVVLRKLIQKIESTLAITDYNLVLRTSPWNYAQQGVVVDENFHWRLEICPRTTCQAGFELGTGSFVNPISPETVASRLKSGKTN